MAKVLLGMTMSLDGFINDRHGSVDRLYPDMAFYSIPKRFRSRYE